MRKLGKEKERGNKENWRAKNRRKQKDLKNKRKKITANQEKKY